VGARGDGVTVLIPRDSSGVRRSAVLPAPGWGVDAAGEVWVRCACGEVLDLDHAVAADGAVSPSLWHDDPACGWHVSARLEDWRPQ
jgi:hypothetical protein